MEYNRDTQTAQKQIPLVSLSLPTSDKFVGDSNFRDREGLDLKEVRLIDFVSTDKAKEIFKQGVSLIKTIDKSLFPNIVSYLGRIFRGYYTKEGFIWYLRKIGGLDVEQATIIAEDQIKKATEKLYVEKLKLLGCKKVRWVHNGGDNPREYHLRRWNGVSGKKNGRPNGLNGYEFLLDTPPVINPKTKERGLPGQMINCHCYLVPLWGQK